MEKYTEFNDLVTGINPYIRIIKHRYTIGNFIFNLGVFRAFLLLPLFLYRYFFGSFVKVKYATESTKQRIRKNRVFLCTYSSIFDLPVLYSIFTCPSVYILRNKTIFSINKYNIMKKITDTSDTSEITKKIEKGDTVIFLMGGGITNGEIYANPDEVSQIVDIQQTIALEYIPNLSYDINLFDLCVIPQFRRWSFSVLYHLLYCIILPSDPVCTVTAESTIHELSEKTRKEISISIDSKTTENFLKQFNFD